MCLNTYIYFISVCFYLWFRSVSSIVIMHPFVSFGFLIFFLNFLITIFFLSSSSLSTTIVWWMASTAEWSSCPWSPCWASISPVFAPPSSVLCCVCVCLLCVERLAEIRHVGLPRGGTYASSADRQGGVGYGKTWKQAWAELCQVYRFHHLCHWLTSLKNGPKLTACIWP